MIRFPGFLDARCEPSLRQPYLDNFLMANPCDSVIYLAYNIFGKPAIERVGDLKNANCFDTKKSDEKKYEVFISDQSMFIIYSYELIGEGEEQPIFINPTAFDEMDEAQFKYDLIYHIYTITQDIKEGIPLPDGKIIDHENVQNLKGETIDEILNNRGLLQQFIRGKDNGYKNTKLYKEVSKSLLNSLGRLEGIHPVSYLERQVIESQTYFARELFVRGCAK